MGLRLIESYFDRSEALVARGALEAAGVSIFLRNFELISIYPFHEVVYGGFQIWSAEEDVEAAVSVLRESLRRPLLEGERLSTHTFMIPSLALFFLGGLLMPLKMRRWHDVDAGER
jgi:hypothetical protein